MGKFIGVVRQVLEAEANVLAENDENFWYREFRLVKEFAPKLIGALRSDMKASCALKRGMTFKSSDGVISGFFNLEAHLVNSQAFVSWSMATPLKVMFRFRSELYICNLETEELKNTVAIINQRYLDWKSTAA